MPERAPDRYTSPAAVQGLVRPHPATRIGCVHTSSHGRARFERAALEHRQHVVLMELCPHCHPAREKPANHAGIRHHPEAPRPKKKSKTGKRRMGKTKRPQFPFFCPNCPLADEYGCSDNDKSTTVRRKRLGIGPCTGKDSVVLPPIMRSLRLRELAMKTGEPTHECATCAADKWGPEWEGKWEPCWMEPKPEPGRRLAVFFRHQLPDGSYRRLLPAGLVDRGLVRVRERLGFGHRTPQARDFLSPGPTAKPAETRLTAAKMRARGKRRVAAALTDADRVITAAALLGGLGEKHGEQAVRSSARRWRRRASAAQKHSRHSHRLSWIRVCY